MNAATELPMWAAVLVSALVLIGAVLTLIGAAGLLRLTTFYERVHAPTMGSTLGTGLVLAGSIVLASVLASRPVLHEIAIGVFMTVTTPVTFMLLFRAAVLRSGPRHGGAGDGDGESARPGDAGAGRAD